MKKLILSLLLVPFLLSCSSEKESPNINLDSDYDANQDKDNSSDSATPPSPPSTALIHIAVSTQNQTRSLVISWSQVAIGTSYSICHRASSDTCTAIKSGMGSDGVVFLQLSTEISLDLLLQNQLSIEFIDANNSLIERQDLMIDKTLINNLIQYLKASNFERNDQFGTDIAISANGNVLAIGAPFEDSANNNPDTVSTVFNSGAVYIFTDTPAGWRQSAFVKFSHPNNEDEFGSRVALSDDGRTLAVAMPNDDSIMSGVTIEPNDNTAVNSGAVVIFTNTDATGWQQSAILKSTQVRNYERFGSGGLALSGDGNTVAVGTLNSHQVETYIKGVDGNWSVLSTLSSAAIERSDRFGEELDLNQNGTVLVIGAPGNDSNQQFDGFSNNLLTDSGGVYIFRKEANATSFQESAFFKPATLTANAFFGLTLSLSSTGTTLAVGSDTSEMNSVYIFDYQANSNLWQQRYAIETPNFVKGFGINLELNGDASMLAVYSRASQSVPGINGDVTDSRVDIYGHLSVFELSSTLATQKYTFQPMQPEVRDLFGRRSAFSQNGRVLATVASHEDAIPSTDAENSPTNSGAAWVYHF